jgi:hypothetical protein
MHPSIQGSRAHQNVWLQNTVEGERLFSAASFVVGKYRRRLNVSLEKCVRMRVQNLFTLENFPFDQALKKWNEASSIRGRYHGFNRHCAGK